MRTTRSNLAVVPFFPRWPQDRYRTFSHEATEEGGIDIIDLVTMQRVLNRYYLIHTPSTVWLRCPNPISTSLWVSLEMVEDQWSYQYAIPEDSDLG